MSKTDEIRRDQELSDMVRPQILAALRDGDEPLAISAQLASEHGIDERKAYRWVLYSSETFEKRRRRIQALGLLGLWTGVLGASVTILLTIFTDASSAWITGVASGLPLAVAGAVVSARSRRLVRSLD